MIMLVLYGLSVFQVRRLSQIVGCPSRADLGLSKTYMYFLKYEDDSVGMKVMVSQCHSLRLVRASSLVRAIGPCSVVRAILRVYQDCKINNVE